MTKNEQKTLDNLRQQWAQGGSDGSVARGLAVLFRGARTEKSRLEILRHVRFMDLLHHDQFDIFAV